MLRAPLSVPVRHPHKGVHHAAAVDQGREYLLVPLLGGLNQDPQRSEGSQNGKKVPEGDDAQHSPGCPVGEVLDEDQSHQGGNENQVGLLHNQRRLPVNGNETHHAKVPDENGGSDVVQRQVVSLEYLSQVQVGEEEEEHQT